LRLVGQPSLHDLGYDGPTAHSTTVSFAEILRVQSAVRITTSEVRYRGSAGTGYVLSIGHGIGEALPSSEAAPGYGAVFTDPGVPRHDEMLVAWIGVPRGTAFVTYLHGRTRLWQRPARPTAAFVVPWVRLADRSPIPRAGDPTLTAYDANGRVLQTFWVYTRGGAPALPGV
jgi:hypothetical protein